MKESINSYEDIYDNSKDTKIFIKNNIKDKIEIRENKYVDELDTEKEEKKQYHPIKKGF